MISSYKNFKHDYRMVVYHFTTIYNLYNILSEFSNNFNNYKIILNATHSGKLSLTRNYNMKSRELRIDKRCCRIALNYNKLKAKYKIKPFFDTNYKDDTEREEKIYNATNDVDITNSIIQIDILSKPVFDESLEGNLNTYYFGDYFYLHKQVEVINRYYEFLDKIQQLNIISIPINIVHSYNIIK